MDYIVRATAADGQIRAFAATTRETVETAREDHNTSPVATAALGRTQPDPQAPLLDSAVSWLSRLSAWMRRARTGVVEFGARLPLTELKRRLGVRPALGEKLGYSAMLVFAGLALSPITLIDLTERVASSSGSSWLTALLVAIASGRPVLDVTPALLDVLAGFIVTIVSARRDIDFGPGDP